jgi:hypothetical protein
LTFVLLIILFFGLHDCFLVSFTRSKCNLARTASSDLISPHSQSCGKLACAQFRNETAQLVEKLLGFLRFFIDDVCQFFSSFIYAERKQAVPIVFFLVNCLLVDSQLLCKPPPALPTSRYVFSIEIDKDYSHRVGSYPFFSLPELFLRILPTYYGHSNRRKVPSGSVCVMYSHSGYPHVRGCQLASLSLVATGLSTKSRGANMQLS